MGWMHIVFYLLCNVIWLLAWPIVKKKEKKTLFDVILLYLHFQFLMKTFPIDLFQSVFFFLSFISFRITFDDDDDDNSHLVFFNSLKT